MFMSKKFLFFFFFLFLLVFIKVFLSSQFLTFIVVSVFSFFVWRKANKRNLLPSSCYPSNDEKKKNGNCFGSSHLQQFYETYNISLPPMLVLATDLDETLIGVCDNETHEQGEKRLKQFNEMWLTQYAPKNCVLVYATGRTFEKYQLAAKEWPLLKPDILICQDGIKIYWFNKQLANLVESNFIHKSNFVDQSTQEDFILFDKAWDEHLEEIWNQQYVETTQSEIISEYSSQTMTIPIQRGRVERFFVCGIAKTREIAMEVAKRFKDKITQHNVENLSKNSNFVKMDIHYTLFARSNNSWFVTVLPSRAGKGGAVSWVQSRLYFGHNCDHKIVVCGDNENDISMLTKSEYCSVIMNNSTSELINYYEEYKHSRNNMIKTEQPRTLGVIEGLQYFSKIVK